MHYLFIISAIVANILGVTLHFTHNKKTKSPLIHSISAVNESTWEHLKLAFMPMFFIAFIQYALLCSVYPNVMEANFVGILLTLTVIPAVYYPVHFSLKKEILWISIAIFLTSVSLGYVLSYQYIVQRIVVLGEPVSLLLLFAVASLFVWFTKSPPKLFLFKDPISRKYGDKF